MERCESDTNMQHQSSLQLNDFPEIKLIFHKMPLLRCIPQLKLASFIMLLL